MNDSVLSNNLLVAFETEHFRRSRNLYCLLHEKMRLHMECRATILLASTYQVITPILKKNATVKAIATLAPSTRRGRVRNPIDYTEVRRALEAGHKSKIEWITDQEIVEAGKQLLKLKRVGVQCEKKMDFANSGKIAYKLRDFVSEIRKTTKSALDH